MESQTIISWMFIHPYMTFFILLGLADGIGHIGRTEYKCDKCDK